MDAFAAVRQRLESHFPAAVFNGPASPKTLERLRRVLPRGSDSLIALFALCNGMDMGLDDSAVGQLMDEAGEDTEVLILSDHGAGALRKGLNLIEVLARAGLLTRKPQHPLDKLRQFGVWAFAEHAPGSVKRWVKAQFPNLSEGAAQIVACSDIDFSRTRAYPAGETDGVFVNLRGRQPKGMVGSGGR